MAKAKRSAASARAGFSSLSRSKFFTRHDNVAFYVPNLIGYTRVACAAYAFSVALTRPVQFMAFYFFSFVCDELDGRFARLLGQSSNFGAVLDMVTDRLATACLLALLCALYPAHLPLPLFLLALDVASHWAQVAATAAAGSQSHKEEGAASSSAIVRAYYSNRLFMGACCVSCEVLYLALYSFRGWEEKEGNGGGPPRVPLPAFLGRAAAAVVNGVAGVLESASSVGGGVGASSTSSSSSSSHLGRRFLEDGLPPPTPKTPWSPPSHVPLALLFALLSVPGFAVKQAINWRQMRTAFGELARHDVEVSRRGARKGAAAAAAAAAAASAKRA